MCFLQPIGAHSSAPGYKIIVKRLFTEATVDAIASELGCKTNWSVFYSIDDCQAQADMFYAILCDVIDRFAPVQHYKIKNNDRPWITPVFVNLVKQRDFAFDNGDSDLYRSLRNKVNRLRKSLHKRYFDKSIQQLKKHDPSRWWREVKKLGGVRQNSTAFENLCFEGKCVESSDLPNVINDYFRSVAKGVHPLDPDAIFDLRRNLSVCPDEFIVSEMSVFYAMKKLRGSKASLFDIITNQLLIDLAGVLAGPICSLINSSIRNGFVPNQWRVSRICPIPKTVPMLNVESDLRPIAISCPISKVAESFISNFFNDHFESILDDNQFGATRNRSTTLVLIKFADHIFEASDDRLNFIRVLFVDFSKAFDVVDHNVLFKKFVDCNFPAHLALWSLSFLQDRSQFVKIGNLVSSSGITNAGAPQGTRAGPDDFRLLINDLKFSLPYFKYVDDVTVASVSHNFCDSSLQSAVDYLVTWCKDNGMILNTRKTKEIIVHFGRHENKSAMPLLKIDQSNVERVESFKLLGVYFSADLSWGVHVSYILKKSAKRFYVIHQLVRARINSSDVVSVYCSLIRSILEYACPVWHTGLTVSQSNDVENVQKRVLRIIFPGLFYSEALVFAGLERLSIRRERLTRELFTEMKSPSHVLNKCLPMRHFDASKPNVRDFYPYSLPIARTNRYASSFIPYCIRKRF